MAFFGFDKVEPVGNAIVKTTYITESDKNFQVNILTQKFKLIHSGETSKIVIHYGVDFGISRPIIYDIYLLKRDWTIDNYVPASSEVTKDLTNDFDGYSIMYVVKDYLYKFSFKESYGSKTFEHTISYAEMSYVTGGVPPLKLTATTDVVLYDLVHTSTIDGMPFESYSCIYHVYIRCDDDSKLFLQQKS